MFALLLRNGRQCTKQRKRNLPFKHIHSQRFSGRISAGIIQHVILNLEGKPESYGIFAGSIPHLFGSADRSRPGDTCSLKQRGSLAIYDFQIIIFIRITVLCLLQLEHLPLSKISQRLRKQPYYRSVSYRVTKYEFHCLYKPIIPDKHGNRRPHERPYCRNATPLVTVISHIIMQQSGIVKKLRSSGISY